VLIVLLCCASIPAPANAATSAAKEIEIGQAYDKQILATTNLVSDPLIDAWVGGIGKALFAETARKDIPYSIKVLDVPDVNAFSTLGGFIYLDSGALDFVQSDDELAGVIGHETGHIERRHVLQNASKVGVLNVLFGIGSLFSPFVYRFGELMEAGVVAKIEREDETQADRYGLMLMTRAGYDPDAMVSFMAHLGAYAGDPGGLLDKYFADHPDTPDRVAALVSYPELDPKVRTAAQRLAAAIHDEDEGRYAIAARGYATVLKSDPVNPIALYHLGTTQLALGRTAEGEANLTQAAAAGTPETQAQAGAQLAAARAGDAQLATLQVDLQPLRDRLAAAETSHAGAAAAIDNRADAGRDQLTALEAREEALSYELPDLSQVQARPGSRLDAVLVNLATMSRAIDAVNAKAQRSLAGSGSPVRARAGGLIRSGGDILRALEAQLATAPPAPQTLAVTAAYPHILGDVAAADADLVRSVDAARASLALLDLGFGDLDRFVRGLQGLRLTRGDLYAGDYDALVPQMRKALDGINRAAVAASQAAQLYDLARAEQIEARIDQLGLAATPLRYASLQRALDARFHNATIGYQALLDGGLTPGEAVAASVAAADSGTTPQALVDAARNEHRSVIAEANVRGVAAFALKVFMGLVLFDYVDDPDQEARPQP
jgi:predicted Zn-dependent protease